MVSSIVGLDLLKMLVTIFEFWFILSISWVRLLLSIEMFLMFMWVYVGIQYVIDGILVMI